MRNRVPPSWLWKSFTSPSDLSNVKSLLGELQLNTVCREAKCPNLGECFAQGTATFLILGNVCTRNCTFCAVSKGSPAAPDTGEPWRVSEAVARLGLKYVVITSVTRDDLADGGASHFATTLEIIHSNNPGVKVEVLVPDFGGSLRALQVLLGALPEVVAHDIETVPSLYPSARPKADYQRSLDLLLEIKNRQPNILTKSAMMLGLGETSKEVIEVMGNLREVGVDLIALGQYLSPSRKHHKVERYVHPKEFDHYAQVARQLGFKAVASGPWVRSSYRAAEMYSQATHLRPRRCIWP